MVVLPVLPMKTVKFTCLSVSRSLFNIGIFERFYTISNKGSEGDGKHLKLPEEPQNCCMSGCANCVWVAYAEELAKILNDGGETAKQKIMEQVKDPNLRAFLMLELHHLFKKQN